MQIPARCLTVIVLAIALATPALAQDDEILFADGTITITETPDYEKIVSFNGKEIGRDFMAWFDRIVTVRDTEVALIAIGPGGNACGVNTLLLWSDGQGGVNADKLPGDCGWPAPAVSDYSVYFIPWVGPGEDLPVQRWTPDEGFHVAGTLRFTPEPGTGWADLVAAPVIYPLDYFSNEAFFTEAASILGGELAEYALGLRVSSEMAKMGGDLYVARGCVPHNCGGADSVLVVDTAAKRAWFAQMRGDSIAQWPDAAAWPAAPRAALEKLLND